ncbi:MAG: hypothetical protein IJ594_06755 [Oscillospiraceae bacterium]|nr:hypothetical protein [Oscillospiraceae bacterium]
MLKLYGKKRAQRLIDRSAAYIGEAERRFHVPAACVRAVLYQEMTGIDLLDPVADLAVRFYWLRRRLRRGPLPARSGALGKKDSSTGWGQIFAYVAIRALNFAEDRGLGGYAALGLPAGQRLREDRDEDLRRVWFLLHRDRRANILLTAMNLLAAADEMTGRCDFASFSPDELRLVFTRYNANVRRVTRYGEEVYAHYLRCRAGEPVGV